MKAIKRLFCILTATTMLFASACGQKNVADTNAEPSASSTSATAPSEAPSTQQAAPDAPESPVPSEATATDPQSPYPVTITTYNYAGEEVTTTYEKAPEKVLAVYQGCIETMIALGLEDHVIASYGLDNEVKEEWKAGLEKMHYDDSIFAPEKETVVMLGPDMIFSWGSYFGEKKLGDVDYWINAGTNPYVSTNTRRGDPTPARTLENEYTDILNIGKIFNVEDKAQAIVDAMKQEIADVLTANASAAPQSAAIIEFTDSITNYGKASLGGDMLTKLGATLALPDAKSIGNEDLIAADPDVIFVVYMQYDRSADSNDAKQEQLDKLLNEPAFASLKAIRNGRVYPIMLGDMYASTVRSIDGIRTFAQGLYPSESEQ